MADEETKIPEGAAGSPAENTGSTFEGAVPKPEEEHSPFLGKLVVPKTDALKTGMPAMPATVPVGMTTSSPLSGQAPQKSDVSSSPSKPSPEDLLHGGNIITLLEREAQKTGELPTPISEEALSERETPIERSIREIGLQPRPEKIRQQQEEGKKKEREERIAVGGLPHIRTYASDMSEEIRKRGETLATIISAERNKMGKGPIGDESARLNDQPEKAKIRNTFLLGGAGLLAIIGITAVIIVWFLMRSPAPSPPHVGLITANRATALTIDQRFSVAEQLAAQRATAHLDLGEVEELIITKDGVPLSASEVLTLLGAPSVLSRNANALMIGIHAFDRNQPFILVSVSAYDRAFEGALLWENHIGPDLGAFFAPTRALSGIISSTPPFLIFTDRVFQNIDIRESGTVWPIVYMFPQRDLLLITTNENTIKEILTRLSQQQNN